MEANKNLSPIVTELFLRVLNISIIFKPQSYFKVTKTKCNALFYYENT